MTTQNLMSEKLTPEQIAALRVIATIDENDHVWVDPEHDPDCHLCMMGRLAVDARAVLKELGLPDTQSGVEPE